MPTRTRTGRDLRFTVPASLGGGTLSVSLLRGADKDGRKYRIQRQAVPAEENQSNRLRETPRLFDDLSQGAGFGRRRQDTSQGYHYGTFLWARDRGMFGPSGELTEISLGGLSVTSINFGFTWTDGSLYLSCNNDKMLKVTNNGTSISVVDAGVTFPAGATSLDCAVFKDKAWVCLGQGARIYSFNGTTWTAATDDVRRDRFAVTNWTFGRQLASSVAGISAGTTQRTLVSYSAGDKGVYHCTGDPGVTNNHAGPNYVGDQAYGVQVFHATAEAVFAGTAQGVFMLMGGGRFPNLTPWWANQLDPSNGAELQMHDGSLFAALTNGLDMVTPDVSQLGEMTLCHPGAYESFEESPVYGWPRKLITDSGWLLAWFWNGERSYLMAGKKAARLGINSRNPIIWHGSECDVAGAITFARVLPSVDNGPRWLLFASLDDDGTPHLWTQSLPREPSPYAAWKNGGAHRFSSEFTITFSADDFGDADAPKVLRYWGAVTENASNTNTLTISTSTDKEASVEQVVVNQSPRQFSTADETSARGHMIEVTASGQSEPDSPIVVRSVKVRGTINDEKTVLIEYPISITAEQPGGHATLDTASARMKLAQLYDLLDIGPVTMYDHVGRERLVVIEDISEDETPANDDLTAVITARVTVSVLQTSAVYSGSDVYGASRYA